jgi:hypothetical protein
MNSSIRKNVALGLVLALSLQLAACGTIIYPERRGQSSGQLDPAIIAANGVGLLFFFVPGVVAFAVDFSTGAIYKGSGTESSALNFAPFKKDAVAASKD